MEPHELDLDEDPYSSFDVWFEQAERRIEQAEAVALATVGTDGMPSQRVVLYKGRSGAGFRFFTNYTSPKAADLGLNPNASMLFFWQPLRRQVRLGGVVERLSREESEEYFASRDRGSQLGAWASSQSTELESRGQLMAEVDAVAARYAESDVPCPPLWGGFRLIPDSFEYWQGMPDRLHDRFLYSRRAGDWVRRRLAP